MDGGQGGRRHVTDVRRQSVAGWPAVRVDVYTHPGEHVLHPHIDIIVSTSITVLCQRKDRLIGGHCEGTLH